jgi:hypothetical protein
LSARGYRIMAVAVALVVMGGVGYLIGQRQGEARVREEVGRGTDVRNSMLVQALEAKDEALEAKDEALVACGRTIHQATRIIRLRTLYIQDVFDGALRDTRTAFELGTKGVEEQFKRQVEREIRVLRKSESYTASLISADDWTGWLGQRALALCREGAGIRIP